MLCIQFGCLHPPILRQHWKRWEVAALDPKAAGSPVPLGKPLLPFSAAAFAGGQAAATAARAGGAGARGPSRRCQRQRQQHHPAPR